MDKTLETTLKDLIEIPEVKLVIELDDAERSPQEIISTLVFTDEINEGLKTILSRLNQTCGCGIFIKGNFGCGKSHFLSYLYLLLTAQTDNKDIPKLGKVVKSSLLK